MAVVLRKSTLMAAILVASLAGANPGAPVWTNQSPQASAPVTAGEYLAYPFLAAGATSYSLSSGTLPTGLALSSSGRLTGWAQAGTWTFTVAATNSAGTTVSNPITVTIGYRARLTEAPVEGIPLHYEIPGFTGTIIGQQWYRFLSGSGWVAIAGATGATLDPTGLAGSHLSVRANTSAGEIRSYEFAGTSTVVSRTAVLNGSDQLSYYGTLQNGLTVYTPCVIRAYIGGRYIDNEVGPGFYSSSQLGDLSAYGTVSTISLTIQRNFSMPAVATANAKAAATATRPVSSSTGFFVNGRGVYDPNGNKFAIRGPNYTHYDNPAKGMWLSGANAIRMGTYVEVTWATQKAVIDKIIAAKAAPILARFYNSQSGMKATVSGNTLTLTARTAGRLFVGLTVTVAGMSYQPTITGIGTVDANGLGDYTISGAGATITTAANVTFNSEITGKTDPAWAQAAVQNWVDMFAQFGPYVNANAFLNPANEWGPAGSASNTVWRDTWGYKDSGGVVHPGLVQKLRDGGYTGCIVLDAPGNGQDNYAFINHAASVLAADPLQNIVFSLHIYGSYRPGQMETVFASMRATGLAFIIGEFGPGTVVSPDSKNVIDPGNVMASAENHDFGWLYWAWDEHRATSEPDSNGSFCAVFYWTTGYQTQDPADLTPALGKKVVLNAQYGTAYATPATIFA